MPAREQWGTAVRAAAVGALLLGGGAPFAQQAAPPQAAACAACHGPEGRSQNPEIPSLAGQPRTFIENQLVLIREGLREVPAMKGLLDPMKDPELVALAQYFSAQKPAPAPAPRDREAFQRGQALASKMHCGSCHLSDFRGQQQVPRLAAQPEAFLVQSMKQFRDNPAPGRDTIMASALFGLKDADLADLAHFLAHSN
ncbi:MAG TPA: c-type cytochrome [Ramlibacter sp.]|jgi:cytochrome c553|uniref:c-type cytochrome n=1 Tax=Ramlibacter sp. TaxID=1917967 RepID=UPI002D3CA0C3|nr:c-type cytochrome [Ramlibacter sp.]HZY16838.1 c-type cytochrome [Ramlibacter sp.]